MRILEKSRGFTLVELSIVLVIVGLLIGGVLVARSMIETAKIQTLVRDIQQYDVAVSNFKNNYKSFPGDSPYFDPPGDGDGSYGYCYGGDCHLNQNSITTIGGDPSPTSTLTSVTTTFWGENAAFWPHLVATGLKLKGLASPSVDPTTGIIVNVHVPETPFAKGGVVPVIVSGGFELTSGNKVYAIADLSTSTDDQMPRVGILDPAQSIALDTKFDDGAGQTGNMLISKNARRNTCSSSDIGSTTAKCLVFIKILGQNGL